MNKRAIFKLGEDFHRASLSLIPDDWIDNESEDGDWVVPVVTNLSFACELYFKSLIVSDSTMKGHSLNSLFKKLPLNIQNEILNSAEFNGDEKFNEKLDANKDLFTKWRYCFEGSCEGVDGDGSF